jgi:hypothetical protein
MIEIRPVRTVSWGDLGRWSMMDEWDLIGEYVNSRALIQDRMGVIESQLFLIATIDLESNGLFSVPVRFMTDLILTVGSNLGGHGVTIPLRRTQFA